MNKRLTRILTDRAPHITCIFAGHDNSLTDMQALAQLSQALDLSIC